MYSQLRGVIVQPAALYDFDCASDLLMKTDPARGDVFLVESLSEEGVGEDEARNCSH